MGGDMLSPIIGIPRGRKAPDTPGWQEMSAEDHAKNLTRRNGCNRGVRLDNYATLDPDSLAARELQAKWLKEGVLTPTVAWRTASGAERWLYLRPPELTDPLSITAIKYQLRTGNGLQDVIPPSYVKDTEKGIDGHYAWLPDQDPESIEPAPLPDLIFQYFLTHSNYNVNTNNSNSCASRLDFSRGGRDESLFHLATCLKKGGMGRVDAEKVLVNLAKICDPPFPEKDALRKIESAWKREISEFNLAADAREWVLSSSGVFLSSDFVKEAGLSSMSSREFNKNLSKVFERLANDGLIERNGGRRGCFRRVEKESEIIDFAHADCSTIFDLRWPAPFHLERLVNLYPKNIVILAGATNAGKTALLLNVVRENMDRHKVLYFSSEMGAEELRLRIEKFQLPVSSWRFEARERAANFADAITPDAVNIIDYFELTDNFYQVGGEIKKIFDRLTIGIAIIAIQKDENKEFARGGAFSAEKARLYLSMNPGELKIIKGKNWARPGHNPKGKVFKFKLVDGCNFLEG
jgi:hypothetical protein